MSVDPKRRWKIALITAPVILVVCIVLGFTLGDGEEVTLSTVGDVSSRRARFISR